jgi:hypothetical protein
MGTLRSAQRATLRAIADRLIPSDDHGPGAVQAGALAYVERELDGAYADLLPAYADGLQLVDARARATQGLPLAELAPDAQDAVLRALELEPGAGGAFFELVRRHVFEGMFGDPAYGGNRDRAGWTLLDYTGPQATWTEEEQRIEETGAR